MSESNGGGEIEESRLNSEAEGNHCYPLNLVGGVLLAELRSGEGREGKVEYYRQVEEKDEVEAEGVCGRLLQLEIRKGIDNVVSYIQQNGKWWREY